MSSFQPCRFIFVGSFFRICRFLKFIRFIRFPKLWIWTTLFRSFSTLSIFKFVVQFCRFPNLSFFYRVAATVKGRRYPSSPFSFVAHATGWRPFLSQNKHTAWAHALTLVMAIMFHPPSWKMWAAWLNCLLSQVTQHSLFSLLCASLYFYRRVISIVMVPNPRWVNLTSSSTWFWSYI